MDHGFVFDAGAEGLLPFDREGLVFAHLHSDQGLFENWQEQVGTDVDLARLATGS